jgi:hydrogenase maturation protein HypF
MATAACATLKAGPRLPVAAPVSVLAFGAFLKNQACLLRGHEVLWSALHGDLGTPEACAALSDSTEALLAAAGGRVDAVAHDLHPDFHSTRLALAMAARLQVPAIGVQHHHAHLAVVQAEQGWGCERPIIGLALDGVGLGTDGRAWGGEVLRLPGCDGDFDRVAHLPWLALPGGDVAAREPWRLVAAVLHEAGRGHEIESRFAAQVGAPLARGVATLLARKLNCPLTSSAGRWFDAAAGALRLSLRQAHEAQAAIALEAAATAWLEQHAGDDSAAPGASTPTLDLHALVTSLLDEPDAGRGAARFHLALARGLVAAVVAHAGGSRDVVLGGGCFFNRLLARKIEAGLSAAGLTTWRPASVSVGDAGLALGQAWVAAMTLQRERAAMRTSDATNAAPASTGTNASPARERAPTVAA